MSSKRILRALASVSAKLVPFETSGSVRPAPCAKLTPPGALTIVGGPDVIFSLASSARVDAHLAMSPLYYLYLFIFLNQIQLVVSPIHLASLLKRKQTCFDQTGHELGTLQQIWDRYNAYAGSAPGTFGGQLDVPRRNGLMSRAYHFMCVFIYIHKCPQTNWEESFDLPGGYTVSSMIHTHSNSCPASE